MQSIERSEAQAIISEEAEVAHVRWEQGSLEIFVVCIVLLVLSVFNHGDRAPLFLSHSIMVTK